MPAPTEVHPHSAHELRVDWETGESFAVPYSEVRLRCPCATCVDEMTGERRITREGLAPGIKPLKAETVGRYALKIWWSDRHSSGMYPFDALYEICREAGHRLNG